MSDFLDILADQAKRNVESSYYSMMGSKRQKSRTSLSTAIKKCSRNPIIAEVKRKSPSVSSLIDKFDAVEIAESMINGGAIALSVLTEPKFFDGSLKTFIEIREHTVLPMLMKDFIICEAQLKAAYKIGVNAVLFIQALFDRGYCEFNLNTLIRKAHSMGLEVLLEVYTEEEFSRALTTEADMIGINNRDLRTFKVDLEVTKRILSNVKHDGRLIVAESGIQRLEDIRMLRSWGADAFLIGSAIMSASSISDKVRSFVEA